MNYFKVTNQSMVVIEKSNQCITTKSIKA